MSIQDSGMITRENDMIAYSTLEKAQYAMDAIEEGVAYLHQAQRSLASHMRKETSEGLGEVIEMLQKEWILQQAIVEEQEWAEYKEREFFEDLR